MRCALFACVFAVLCPHIAQARPALESVHNELAALPADVSLVIALTDSALLRRSTIGPDLNALTRNLIGVSEFEGVNDAWRSLAEALNLPGTKAFDQILGKRVLYIEQHSDTEQRVWALVATVGKKTEVRVRKALRPAPRQPIKGRQILAVEGGKFVMSVLEIPGDNSRVRLVLAPDGQRELFLKLVATTGPGAARFGDTLDARRLRDLHPSPPIVLHTKSRAGALNMIGFHNARGLTLSFCADVLGVKDGAMPKPWSRASFDRLAAGAHAAVYEYESDAYREYMKGYSFSSMPVDIAKNFEGKAHMGPRRAMRIESNDRAPLSISVAVEATDVPKLAIHADRAMATFLARVGTGGTDANAELFNFEGISPEAIRTVALQGERQWPGRLLFGDGPEFAWTIQKNQDAQTPAWWVIGTDPRGVRAMIGALLAPGEEIGDARPWVMIAEFRPSSITKLLGPLDVLIRGGDQRVVGFYEMTKRIDSASISAYHDDPDTIKGTARLEFVRPTR